MGFVWFLVSLVIIGADRLVKHLVSINMQVGESFALVPGVLAVTYAQNTGVSFSMFAGNEVAMAVVTWVAVIVCIGLLFALFTNRLRSNLLNAALALLFAGALGNVIDRARSGYVVDMFEFLFVRFAIFNVADISLTFGTVMLVIWVFRNGKPAQPSDS